MDSNPDCDDNDDDFIGPPLPPGFDPNQDNDNKSTNDNDKSTNDKVKTDSDDDDLEYDNDDGIYHYVFMILF